jgi:uncharacterized Zn-binding protein involved in type VI secretion
MGYLDNLSLAVDQKLNNVTGDRTSSSDRVANVLPSMFGTGEGEDHGVLGETIDSINKANEAWDKINDPIGNPPRPPTEAEKDARRVAAASDTVSAWIEAASLPADMFNMGFANLTAPLSAIWPSLPAATLMCLYVGFPHAHTHPPSACPVPVPLPSLGPVLLGTCVQVLINYLPAARAGDVGWAPTCGGLAPWFEIKTGSSNVFIGGSRAARMLDICMACFPATNVRGTQAAQAAARAGKISQMVDRAMMMVGVAAGGVGVVGDIAEASIEDDEAMRDAQILSAAMGVAQMAADVAALIITRTMGIDPGIPPSVGALVIGHPNVLIGGFPMINFPDAVGTILNRLKRHRGQSPDKDNDNKNKPGQAGAPPC